MDPALRADRPSIFCGGKWGRLNQDHFRSRKQAYRRNYISFACGKRLANYLDVLSVATGGTELVATLRREIKSNKKRFRRRNSRMGIEIISGEGRDAAGNN